MARTALRRRPTSPPTSAPTRRGMRTAGALLAAAAGVQAVLVRLGGTLGSTAQERAALLPGDDDPDGLRPRGGARC